MTRTRDANYRRRNWTTTKTRNTPGTRQDRSAAVIVDVYASNHPHRAGGLTGGIIGALVGAGIPEDRAKIYDEDIRNGGIVMGVNPRSGEDAKYFENEWRNSRGENVYR